MSDGMYNNDDLYTKLNDIENKMYNIEEKIDMNQTISFSNKTKKETKKEDKEESNTPEEPKVFVPFSGKGRRLCD